MVKWLGKAGVKRVSPCTATAAAAAAAAAAAVT